MPLPPHEVRRAHWSMNLNEREVDIITRAAKLMGQRPATFCRDQALTNAEMILDEHFGEEEAPRDLQIVQLLKGETHRVGERTRCTGSGRASG